MSKQQIQEINDALPPYFQGNLSWIILAGETRIEEYALAELFKSIEDEQGITEFLLLVEIEDPTDVTFDLRCEEEGSSLAYSCPPEKSGEMRKFARVITSIFHENRRGGWWLPWIRAPILKLGEQPKPYLNLSWNRIIENVISNWLSYLLMLATGLILGYLIGQIL